MRRTIIVTSAITLAACAPPVTSEYEALDWQAGAVTVDANKAVTGHWSVSTGPHVSRAEGGACIVVRHQEFATGGAAPASQPQCEAAGKQVFGPDGYGYYRPDGSCWIKGGHGFCNRTLDAKIARTPTRWDIGDHLANTAPIKLVPAAGHQPYPRVTWWRVTPCLFVYVNGQKQFPCKWGEPLRVDKGSGPPPP